MIKYIKLSKDNFSSTIGRLIIKEGFNNLMRMGSIHLFKLPIDLEVIKKEDNFLKEIPIYISEKDEKKVNYRVAKYITNIVAALTVQLLSNHYLGAFSYQKESMEIMKMMKKGDIRSAQRILCSNSSSIYYL